MCSSDLPANAALLRALAESSGGRSLLPDEVPAALSHLQLKSAEEGRLTYTSLWNRWPVLACLVGLLTVEWVVRKMRNLP